MRKHLAALAALSALTLPVAAQAGVELTYGTTYAIPNPGNDFAGELNGLGLTRYTTTGATLSLTDTYTIKFEFLGSESGLHDRFTAGGVSFTETSSLENHFAAPILMGYQTFGPGSLAGKLVFDDVTGPGGTPLGAAATVGQDGFAILLTDKYALTGSGSPVDMGNVFYFAYDDQVNFQDDNHDDFIVRATLLPAVPEPSTWALMILGFGAIGAGMRSRKANERIRVTYA